MLGRFRLHANVPTLTAVPVALYLWAEFRHAILPILLLRYDCDTKLRYLFMPISVVLEAQYRITREAVEDCQDSAALAARLPAPTPKKQSTKDTRTSSKALFYGLENSGYFLRFLANLNSGQSQYRKENRAKTNSESKK